MHCSNNDNESFLCTQASKIQAACIKPAEKWA